MLSGHIHLRLFILKSPKSLYYDFILTSTDNIAPGPEQNGGVEDASHRRDAAAARTFVIPTGDGWSLTGPGRRAMMSQLPGAERRLGQAACTRLPRSPLTNPDKERLL